MSSSNSNDDGNDLALTPDTYVPNVNFSGNYVDHIPIIKHGILCPCGARKDKVYSSGAKFSIHCKSKKHQSWLSSLNENKANYYSEMLSLKDTVKTQREIIQKLENQLVQRSLTVDFLSGELTDLRLELANIRSGKMTVSQLSKIFKNVKCGYCNMENCWEIKEDKTNSETCLKGGNGIINNSKKVINTGGGNTEDLMGFD